MAYNRENLLKRIIEIQDTVLEYKKMGLPQKVIYEKYIRDRYHISYSRFNEYLATRAKTELREMNTSPLPPPKATDYTQFPISLSYTNIKKY